MALPVSIIVAVASNGVIGSNGGMPWRLSADMKRFKSLTLGNPVVMGRKTFESFPRALPGRHNIVITRNPDIVFEGAVKVASLIDALELAQNWGVANFAKEVFVLGGGEVYRQSIAIADKLYVTKVLANPVGDTRFPEIDAKMWIVDSEEAIPSGPVDSAATSYVVYRKRENRQI